MMQYLGIIEQKTNEIIQMYRQVGSGSSVPSPSPNDIGVPASIPSAPHGTVHIQINPPSLENEPEDHDDDMISEDVSYFVGL